MIAVPIRLTDVEIAALIAEPKPLPSGLPYLLVPAPKMGHREYNAKLTGAHGSNFVVILRQSLSNPLDFSVILSCERPGTSRLFRLRRYNGNSHQHTDKIERQTFLDFHIHTATERYQSGLGAREDDFAQRTTRYTDVSAAVQCLLNDCGFTPIPAAPPGTKP